MDAKKSMKWIILGAITALCLCSFGSYQLLIKRCFFWTCVPNRSFSVLDLGIPSEFFPNDSQIGKMDYPSEMDGAIEAGHMDVFWRQGKGAVHYTVRRFGTEWQARSFIKSLNQMDGEYGLAACPELSNTVISADTYSLGCGRSKFGGYRADLNAKYEEYIITLNVIIDDEMSLEQFQKIVLFIDEQMQQKLETK